MKLNFKKLKITLEIDGAAITDTLTLAEELFPERNSGEASKLTRVAEMVRVTLLSASDDYVREYERARERELVKREREQAEALRKKD